MWYVSERDLAITEAVLDGESAAAAGVQFGVSGERARMITTDVCLKAAPELWERGWGVQAAGLGVLRAKRAAFRKAMRAHLQVWSR